MHTQCMPPNPSIQYNHQNITCINRHSEITSHFVNGIGQPRLVKDSPPIAVSTNCSAVTVGVMIPFKLDGMGPATSWYSRQAKSEGFAAVRLPPWMYGGKSKPINLPLTLPPNPTGYLLYIEKIWPPTSRRLYGFWRVVQFSGMRSGMCDQVPSASCWAPKLRDVVS